MIKMVGEYKCYINENTGENLPVLVGYEREFKQDIDEIMSHQYEGMSIDNPDYLYETIMIAINMTKMCNLACKYCFNQNKENKNISYEDAIRFIDLVISSTPYAKRYIVDLAGSGEPLIELDKILKIADYCYKKSNEINKHIMPQLVSNGTLLTSEVAKKLQEANILFGISIDGKKKTHDMNRVDLAGKGTFDKIIKNVKSIEHRDYIGSAVTLTNDNIKIVDDVKFLSKYFNTISIKIKRPDLNESLDIESMIKEYKLLSKLILKEANKGKLDILKRLLNGDDFFGKYLFRVFGNAPVESRCDAGLGKFSLDSNLNIYVCSGAVGIENLKIGSLDSQIDFTLGKKLQIESAQEKDCISCPYHKLCGGECLVVRNTWNGINKDMCKLKKFLIDLSLYLKGEFLFKYNDLFEELFEFLNEKASRSLGDDELTELASLAKEYSYMELKNLKDNDLEKYIQIRYKYIKK